MSYKQQWYWLQKTQTLTLSNQNLFNYIKLQRVFFLLFLLLLCAHVHLFAPAHSQSTFPVKEGCHIHECLQKGHLRCVRGKPGSA